MRLAHHQFEMRLPLLVMKAELGVAITIGGMRGAIFLPEQLARHSLMFQLFVDDDKVWWGAASDGPIFGL